MPFVPAIFVRREPDAWRNDAEGEPTDARRATTFSDRNGNRILSMLFVETMYDTFVADRRLAAAGLLLPNGLAYQVRDRSFEQQLSITAAHELAHQLFAAADEDKNGVSGSHRKDYESLMSAGTHMVPLSELKLHPTDAKFMRQILQVGKVQPPRR